MSNTNRCKWWEFRKKLNAQNGKWNQSRMEKLLDSHFSFKYFLRLSSSFLSDESCNGKYLPGSQMPFRNERKIWYVTENYAKTAHSKRQIFPMRFHLKHLIYLNFSILKFAFFNSDILCRFSIWKNENCIRVVFDVQNLSKWFRMESPLIGNCVFRGKLSIQLRKTRPDVFTSYLNECNKNRRLNVTLLVPKSVQIGCLIHNNERGTIKISIFIVLCTWRFQLIGTLKLKISDFLWRLLN